MPSDDGQQNHNAPRRPGPEVVGGGSEADRRALTALSQRHGVPALDLGQIAFPLTNLDLLPVEIARRQQVLPVLVKQDAIFLAMVDPSERRVLEELEFVSGKRVFPYVAQPAQLAAAIERAYQLRDRGLTMFQGARAAAAAAASTATPNASASASLAAAPDVGAAHESASADAGLVTSTPGTAPALAPGAFDDDLADPDLRSTGVPSQNAPRAVGPTLDSVFGPLDAVRGQTVLVVDDEEDIRKLLRRVLEEKGYRVLEADRGSVALHMVKAHVPDAIVLDAMLPELHGFDICRRIKASARYGHIPILMISAVYRGWRYAEDLKASYGVNAYIEKPFRISEVVATLEGLLAGAPKADGRDPEALSAEADAALAAGMDAYKAGDLDSAVAHIERGLELDPLSYRLHYHLALLVGRKGDVFRAIQELETAINLHPRSFPALKNLAVLYQQAGFKNKAIELWERAIGHSPDEETRSQIKEHLMSLL